MPVLDESLVMELRRQLKIVIHKKSSIRLRYRLGAIGTLRKLERAAGGSLANAFAGVRNVKVNPLLSVLTIEYDPDRIHPSWWEKLIQDSDVGARWVLDQLQTA